VARLFLDDERLPPEDGRAWAVVRSVAEAAAWVEENGFPAYVSFDNDLGDGVPEGRAFARWLVERDLDTGAMPDGFAFYVHSQNPVAREAIEGVLDAYLAFRARARSP